MGNRFKVVLMIQFVFVLFNDAVASICVWGLIRHSLECQRGDCSNNGDVTEIDTCDWA